MIKHLTIQKIIISSFLLLCVCIVNAQSFQSHNNIYVAARNFLRGHVSPSQGEKIEIKMGKLDSRLRLRQCSEKLKPFLPKGSRQLGKTTVGVKCTGAKPWSIHVPVTINRYKQIMVAAKDLHRGDVLTTSDIKLAKHNLAYLPYGYYDHLASGIGMKLKKRSSAGAVITPAMLKKPQIITRGQQVTILAQSGRMQVRMMGRALSNGAVGERIKVQNLTSKQKLEGVVMRSGEIKVDI